jgi:hypothetical protein
MDEEIMVLRDNEKYALTPIPKGCLLLGGRWVYNVKLVINWNIILNDFLLYNNFIKGLIIAVSNVDILNWNIHLNIFLLCNNFIEGLIIAISNVDILNWNIVLDDLVLCSNFVQSQVYSCVYTKIDNSNKIIIIVWVEDLIITASNINIFNGIKMSLCNKFKVKDLFILTWFLGMKFAFENRNIKINQGSYFDKILTKFKMKDCKPKSVACDIGVRNISDCKSILLEREIAGSLRYLMTCTRPDICYTFGTSNDDLKLFFFVTLILGHLRIEKVYLGIVFLKQLLSDMQGSNVGPYRY